MISPPPLLCLLSFPLLAVFSPSSPSLSVCSPLVSLPPLSLSPLLPPSPLPPSLSVPLSVSLSLSLSLHLSLSLSHTLFLLQPFPCVCVGFVELGRVGDKMHWWIQHSLPPSQQLTLYNAEEEPLLYQEKASQAIFPLNDSALSDNDDSDFEIIVGHEYYDGGSEITSSEGSRTGSQDGVSQVVAAEVIEIKNRRFFHGSLSLKRGSTPPLKVMVDLEMTELPALDKNGADHGVINIDEPQPAGTQQPLPPNHGHTQQPDKVTSQPLSVCDDSVDKPGMQNDNSVHSGLPNSGVVPTSETKEMFHSPGISSSVSMPVSLSELIGRGFSSSPENGLETRPTYTPTVFLTPRSSLPADFGDSLVSDKTPPEIGGEGPSQSPQRDLQDGRDDSLPPSEVGTRSAEFGSLRDLPEDIGNGTEVLYQFPASVVRSVPWSAVSTLQ